jgi:hypothetical protein
MLQGPSTPKNPHERSKANQYQLNSAPRSSHPQTYPKLRRSARLVSQFPTNAHSHEAPRVLLCFLFLRLLERIHKFQVSCL